MDQGVLSVEGVFFFQAEDGIRDYKVTGVQTCALPILAGMALAASLFTALPAMAQNATPKVQIKTSMGDIVLELNEAKAPKTVANFMQYVRDKHYDGTVFHRVMDGFMIQGGGMDASLKEKPTRAPIPLEADNGLKNDRGTIAMARTGNPNSATSQFFINVVNNDMLKIGR